MFITEGMQLRVIDEVEVQDRRTGSRVVADPARSGGGETTPDLTTHEAWAIATQAKTDKPCADCGEIHPYWVMQLDHVPGRGAKAFTISLTYTSGRDRRVLCTRAQLLDEIAKCDIVCANCHAIRTHARGGQRWGRTDGRR